MSQAERQEGDLVERHLQQQGEVRVGGRRRLEQAELTSGTPA